MSEHVAIVGSRPPQGPSKDWYSRVTALVRAYVETLPADTFIVSGGARGVDQIAAHCARERGLRVSEYLPNWDLYGRKAGVIRNGVIVHMADRVIAFWDGKSPGTKITIDMARRAGKPVEIVIVAATQPAATTEGSTS